MKKGISVLLVALTLLASAGAMSGCMPNPIADSAAGIMKNANNSDKEANATELASACKTLYAEVASGVLNADTPADELNDLSSYKLPSAGATIEERKEIAGSLTVADAIAYQGMTSKFNSMNISEYVYEKKYGSIYFKGTYTGEPDGVLTLDMTLNELRGS